MAMQCDCCGKELNQRRPVYCHACYTVKHTSLDEVQRMVAGLSVDELIEVIQALERYLRGENK